MERRNGSNRISFRGWPVAAALAALSLGAQAQTATATSSSAFGQFMQVVTGAGKTTVGVGSDGTPLAAPGVPTAAPDGGSGIKTTHTGEFRNPSGNRVGPVTHTGRVSNANIAGAIGRFIRKVGPIGLLLEVVTVAQEVGYVLTQPTAGGPATVEKLVFGCTSAQVTAGTCYFQISSFAPGGGPATRAATRQASCDIWATPRQGAGSHAVVQVSGIWYCNIYAQNGSLQQTYAIDQVGTPTNIPQPSTIEELEAAIAAKSGWPTNSKVAQATAKASEATGVPVPVDPGSITGPATSQGPAPKVETSTNPDGSTKTTTTTITHNHTYNNDNRTITTTTTTVINITNNGQQGKNDTETKTEQKEEDDSKIARCEDNPGALECVKLETPPAGEIPKSTRDVSFMQENLGWGSGACPANPSWSDVLGSHQVNLQPYCDAITSWVRPLVLAMAALMALAIVTPGFKGAE